MSMSGPGGGLTSGKPLGSALDGSGGGAGLTSTSCANADASRRKRARSWLRSDESNSGSGRGRTYGFVACGRYSAGGPFGDSNALGIGAELGGTVLGRTGWAGAALGGTVLGRTVWEAGAPHVGSA